VDTNAQLYTWHLATTTYGTFFFISDVPYGVMGFETPELLWQTLILF